MKCITKNVGMHLISLAFVFIFIIRLKNKVKPKTLKKSKIKKLCSVEGCENGAVNNGVCRRHGAKKKLCSVEGCENGAIHNGVCRRHGAKMKLCSVEGCENGAATNGVCYTHGAKKKRCSVEGCESLVQNNGVCYTHGAKKILCSVEGCENGTLNNGVCLRHGAKKKKCFSNHCDSNAWYKNEDDSNYYCLDCLLSIKPNDNRLKNFVRKEIYVLAELERRLPWLQSSAVTFLWDMGVDGTCKGRRPDLLCDFGSYVLIIEVDEDQHLGNCVSSEKAKMNYIWEQLGNRPMGFIRFNPDAYTDDMGETHKSAFVNYKVSNGERRVRATYCGEFEQRMECFTNKVEEMVINEIEKVEFLYYDTKNMYEADSPDM